MITQLKYKSPMKSRMLSILLMLITLPSLCLGDRLINITPYPRVMNVEKGELILPQQFIVCTAGLPADMAVEAENFVRIFNSATGYNAQTGTDATNALILIKDKKADMKDEGYALSITRENITIEAKTATGLYYAFQSIRKMLPPNVMAGVEDNKISQYALPLVRISDYPSYGYRGFMLDTSRHFFTVKELKRVLEVMSYYKMNRFHWHLTDDQGWRIEIKKYPRLTTIGSISDNSYMVDMKHGDYWLNQPYGPYFYTQEQVKEIVGYAQERHIEIVPEIDMPGHFCAAMAAYPEYSCTPEGGHQVVSNIGGVYSDVMNVANPQAVQFAKDILTEIMELFPGEYIHIGGDECPTTAWERNEECIAKKEQLGLNSFRELQSHFIKDMADHLKANGRKISVWNEAISAQGADTKTIKETGATVYCWTGADGAVAQASQLGLDHIYTPQVPWYINRKQSTSSDEPVGAGPGTDNLEVVYKQNIPVGNAKYFTGVQATFWSEYVANGEYLEYLMLPRLVAIAEAGWTPKNKMNFDHFCQRITADSALYNYNNYQYGKHYMVSAETDEKVMPNISTQKKAYWYRLVTQAGGERAEKCMELLSDNSPLLTAYKGKGAEPGRLWTNVQATETDANYLYQFWALEEDNSRPGHYALVNKAAPEGSLSPAPTASSNTGRWTYDYSKKHFNFILADNGYGKSGDSYYYSIRCDQINGMWLNASLGGQGYAVNLYNKPSDGNGGLWRFMAEAPTADAHSAHALISEAEKYLADVNTYETPADKQPGLFGKKETDELRELLHTADISAMTKEELDVFTPKLNDVYAKFRLSFGYLEQGKIYTINNTVEDFKNITIFDNLVGNHLRHTEEIWTDNAWTITESKINADYSQTVKLKNVQTHRFIGTNATSITPRFGYAVNISNQGAQLVSVFQPESHDYILAINSKNLYPVVQRSSVLPGTICAGADSRSGNAIRPQGAAWTWTESKVITYDCYDTEGKALGTFRRSFPVHATDATQPVPPTIQNYEYVETKGGQTIYRRTAYAVEVICEDLTGALLSVENINYPVGEKYVVNVPNIAYYKFSEADYEEGEALDLTDDLILKFKYTTTAYTGVKKAAQAVTTLEKGHSYLIYDTSPNDAARKGYRNVNKDLQVMRSTNIEGAHPNHVWILEQFGSKYKVKNAYCNLYVPLLQNSTPAIVGKNSGLFSFTLNADGTTWKIKGNNGVCWDGLGNGALVGWNDPGHPYQIFKYFAQPYFKVTIQTVDTEGKVLVPQTETLVKAGDSYTLTTETIEGYSLKSIEGAVGLESIAEHKIIKVVYEDDSQTGIEEIRPDRKTEGIFDLSGRKLQRISHKGLYIVNGQKMMVK